MRTQLEVRRAFRYFWRDMQSGPVPNRLPNGDYPTDYRCAFVDFVDMLARNGEISEDLAQRVTL